MKLYPQNYNTTRLEKFGLEVLPYIELAKRGRLDKEAWVQKALFALAVTNNQSLAKALITRLKMKAVIEELDPFPFATPSEKDFL